MEGTAKTVKGTEYIFHVTRKGMMRAESTYHMSFVKPATDTYTQVFNFTCACAYSALVSNYPQIGKDKIEELVLEMDDEMGDANVSTFFGGLMSDCIDPSKGSAKKEV